VLSNRSATQRHVIPFITSADEAKPLAWRCQRCLISVWETSHKLSIIFVEKTCVSHIPVHTNTDTHTYDAVKIHNHAKVLTSRQYNAAQRIWR